MPVRAGRSFARSFGIVSSAPILFLTARITEKDKVNAACAPEGMITSSSHSADGAWAGRILCFARERRIQRTEKDRRLDIHRGDGDKRERCFRRADPLMLIQAEGKGIPLPSAVLHLPDNYDSVKTHTLLLQGLFLLLRHISVAATKNCFIEAPHETKMLY